MPLKSLSSNAIRGEMARQIDQAKPSGLVEAVTYFEPNSDQFTENYKWLGDIPQFKPWVGNRRGQELRDYEILVVNEPYETTLSVYKDEIDYDKTGQVQNRIDALPSASNNHWERLVFDMIQNGHARIGYDGQNFFDTDHSVGDSGTFSNMINVSLASLPIATAERGTTTNPSGVTLVHATMALIQQMLTFRSDRNEPINDSAKSFAVVVPITWMAAAAVAGDMQVRLSNGSSNPLASTDFQIKYIPSPRLAWTDTFAAFRTDGIGNARPFVRTQMGRIETSMEDLIHRERRMEYGLFVRRGIGYGLPEHGVRGTLVS